MAIPGNLLTTAMGVMPHADMDRALEVALSVDIPYWPQLPNYSYYEDMYVQASEHFPGIVLDVDEKKLSFSMDRFVDEFEEAYSHMDDEDYYDISETYSSVYHRFLDMDLLQYPAIRGQLEGPISFGFKVLDQNDRPILFDDTIRPFMYEFMAKRINVQMKKLKSKNKNAFILIDEPGLQFLFSAMSGYNNIAAKSDMENFMAMIERPRGVHLCGNPDWDFLLDLDMEILSLDAYTNANIIANYAKSITKFIENGGVMVWGVVPTNVEDFNRESLETMIKRQEEIWKSVTDTGLDRELLFSRSLLSPATCCLINPDREKTVEKSFVIMKELSMKLREKFNLS